METPNKGEWKFQRRVIFAGFPFQNPLETPAAADQRSRGNGL